MRNKNSQEENSRTQAESKNPNGYLVELFSSFQGEGGSVRGSCFGRRQIFIRFAGCSLRCEWCDSAKYRDPVFPECRIETNPGSWEFAVHKNPVAVEFIIEQVLNLSTKDLHSVSLTGGEPTHQENFFYAIINRLYDLELPIFLETAGYFPSRIEKIAPMLSYACVDIKDRSANCVKNSEWEDLVEKELKSLMIVNNSAAKGFAKYVVTEQTSLADVRLIADKIREIVIPIVIQPVTAVGKVGPISNEKLFKITETIAEVIPTDLFSLSIQGHKLLKLL